MKKVLESLFGASPSEVHLGLDLGQKRTKLVAVASRGGRTEVVQTLDVPTLSGLFSNGRLADPEAAAKYLGRLLQQQKVRARKVGISIGAGDAYVKRQEVPEQDREMVLRGLRASPALQIDGTQPSNVVADYHEIPAGVSRPGIMSVLAVTARKDGVRQLQQAVQDAGLDVTLVSVPQIALANAWAAAHDGHVSAGARSVLVHGGQTGVMVVVLEGAVPLTTHYAYLGMESLLDRAKSANPGVAENVLEQALYEDDDAGVSGAAVAEWVGRIAQEVRRTTGVLPSLSGSDGAGVGRVWVSGGVARVPALAHGLAETLGSEVEVFDPISLLGVADGVKHDVFGPALALAVGVAAESLVLEKERVA